MWNSLVRKIRKLYNQFSGNVMMAGILLAPVFQDDKPQATVIGERILKFIAVAGGIYLLARTYFGKKSIAEAEGWDSIMIPIQRFGGAGIALFFALDLIAESVFGATLGSLILDFFK
jgi:hypothetical protein